MTTALEQHEHDLEQLVQIARAGEEVVLTKDGRAVAKITAFSPVAPAPVTGLKIEDALAPGIPPMEAAEKNQKPLPGVFQNSIGTTPAPRVPGSRKAAPGAIRDWITKARAAAAASATGKRGLTVDEIIDDLRSERS